MSDNKLSAPTLAAVEQSQRTGRVVFIDLDAGAILSWPPAPECERQEVVRAPPTKARTWSEVIADLVLGPM